MIVTKLSRWPGMDWRNELDRMRKDMERLASGLVRGHLREGGAGVFPLVNLTEDNENFYLRAELPGIKAEDLEISVTGNSITLSGERKIPNENESATYHRREREAGRFSRNITLPDRIDNEKIEAESKNGVLTVTLPKAEETKPRKIDIKSS
jgi:HSP20 family protein